MAAASARPAFMGDASTAYLGDLARRRRYDHASKKLDCSYGDGRDDESIKLDDIWTGLLAQMPPPEGDKSAAAPVRAPPDDGADGAAAVAGADGGADGAAAAAGADDAAAPAVGAVVTFKCGGAKVWCERDARDLLRTIQVLDCAVTNHWSSKFAKIPLRCSGDIHGISTW